MESDPPIAGVAWKGCFRVFDGGKPGTYALGSALSFALVAYILAAQTAFATNPPSLLNPNVFSYQSFSPVVDGASGALTQSIQFDIPPGRNGVQPDLSLDYNSQNTAQDSIVGYGWTLSIPYIERLNKTGSENIYGPDAYFTSSLDGELATASSTTVTSTTTPATEYFGQFTHGGGNDWLNANQLVCTPYTSPSDAGTMTSISQYWNIANIALNVRYVIYSNTGTIIASSSPISISAPGWSTSTVLASLSSSTPYCLGDIFQTNPTGNTAYDYHASGSAENGGTNSYSSPTNAAFSTLSNYSQTIYAAYTPPSTSTTTTQIVPNLYAARVDDGSFRQYSYSSTTDTWTMYDKKGNEYIFGASGQSRVSATTSQTGTIQTFKWMLEKQIDPNGNYIRFAYSKDHNQIYPAEILYTGHGSSDGPMAVTFATSSRPDAAIDFAPGFEVDTNYRISQIAVTVSSTTVRQYDLSYTSGNNGYRSLLSSVQESGWNASGAETTLPPWTFGYVSSSTPFVTSAWGSSGCTTSGDAYVPAGVLGDGLSRSVAFTYDGVSYQVRISNDTSSPLTSPSANGYFLSASASANCPEETGARLVDVAGNGMATFVQNWFNYNTGTSTFIGYYPNSSGIWSAATTTYRGTIPQFYVSAPGFGAAGTTGIFGDVNGTGLPAYEQNISSGGMTGVTNGVYLPNGSAWNSATTTIFVPAESFPSSGPDCTNSQLVDVNGDRLDDWVYTDGSRTYVLPNNGTGWGTSDSRWTLGTSTVYSSGGNCYDRGWRFIDVNGDGLLDLVRSYTNTGNTVMEGGTYQTVYLNTGHGWATSTAYTLPYIVTPSRFAGTNQVSDSELANFIGSGQQYQDVLATTTNPKGGVTSATFGYTTQSGANPKLPYNLLVVTKFVQDDGIGDKQETDYSYSGGLQYLPSNIFDRKFAGFAAVTASTSVASTTTYYSQGSTTTAPIAGDQSDGYGQLNRPYRQDSATPAGALVRSSFFQYNTIFHGSSEFVGLTRKLEQDYASDGSHQDKDTDYQYSTTTDDLIQSIEYGEVAGNSDGTFSTTSASLPRTTYLTYAASSSVNLSVPIEKKLLNSAGATTTDAKYFYDGLSFGQVSAGNLTQEQDWISGTRYASSTKTYNGYGLVATSTDRNGNATSYEYDSLNLYPATTTNALSQSTTYGYSLSNGKVATSTDPNGSISVNKFDGVGRVIEIDESDPANPGGLLTKSTFSYTDSTSTPWLVHGTSYLNSASSTETYDYYDGLSRLVQERTTTETTGTYAVTDRKYDLAGNLSASTLPYFSSGSSRTSATTTGSLYSTYAYDPLGRVTRTANAVGTTTNAYPKWTTTTTDPNGNVKDYTVDAFDNLAQVVEHNISSNATTTYAYDASNNLATTTDALGNIRTFSYDGLGSRLSATDLHAPGAGSYGSWTYAYDDQGNETSRTDPKSQTITHTYDALNRMLTEDWTGHGTQISEMYDSCANGIGRLCTASTSAAADTYAYDVLGRTANATTTVQGTDYGLAYGHDRQGNVTSVTNGADGAQVSFIFNGAGLVSTVARTVSGTSSQIASLSGYAPTNQVGSIVFGNNASTTYVYSPSQLYRLQQLLTVSPNATTTVTTTYPVASSSIESYWNFDGNSTDAVGSVNGSDTGVSYASSSALINQGASFGGSSSSISLASTSFETGTGDFTIALWMNIQGSGTSPVGNYRTLFASQGTNSRVYLAWDAVDATKVIEFEYYDGANGVAVQSSGGYAVASGWHLVVATRHGGTGTLYVDGSQVGQNTFTFGTPASANLSDNSTGYIGGKASGAAAGFFNGYIDETSFWYRTLSPSEIAGLYDSGAGIAYPFAGTTSTSTADVQLENFSYTYDADGNILTRTDNATGQGQQVTYSYDALNRLLSASTTIKNTNGYSQAFTYDALGNILSGPAGTYAYGGGSGANPDAVTQIFLTTGASSPTIGYDNSAIAGNGIPASSLTFSYTTNSNSNGLLIVSVAEATTSPACTSDVVTGATDNGFSLTDAGYYVRNTTTVNGALKTYDEFTPAQGTHNIVVSASASCILYASAATYTGVKQSGFPDASGSGNPLSDSGAVPLFQATTTTANHNAWAILVGVPSVDGTATEGSNTTVRQQQPGMLYYGDSNGPVSPTGAIGLNWTMPSSAHWLANYFSITPVVSNPGVTSTSSLAYDPNGNVTSVVTGATTTSYAYDYLNRLATSTVAGTVTTYGYDAFGSRVFQQSGNVTTVYPNKYYSVVTTMGSGTSTTATSTDFVFLTAQTGGDDRLLATVDTSSVNGVAGSSTTRNVHTDNLGSTAVTSDPNGNPAQWFDYAPYGSVLASSNSGTTTAARQFIGQFADASGLSYLQARYYDGGRAQFLSEDPAFLQLGDANQLQQTTAQAQQAYLTDPQQLNAYAYSRDNPIIRSDPTGKQAVPAILLALEVYGVAQISVDSYDAYNTDYRYKQVFNQQVKDQTNTKLGYDTTLALLGESEVQVGKIVLGRALSALGAAQDALDTYFSDQVYRLYNKDRSDNQASTVSTDNGSHYNSNQPTSISRPIYSTSDTQAAAPQHSSSADNGQLVQSLSSLVGALNSLIGQLSGSQARAP